MVIVDRMTAEIMVKGEKTKIINRRQQQNLMMNNDYRGERMTEIYQQIAIVYVRD